MGKWHVLRYGTGSGCDRILRRRPVATAPGTVPLLPTRLTERSALIERISIRALAEVSKVNWLLKTPGESVCSRSRRWLHGRELFSGWGRHMAYFKCHKAYEL